MRDYLLTLLTLLALSMQVVKHAPAREVVLYDAELHTRPSEQDWPFFATPLLGHSVQEVFRDGVAILNTTDPSSDRGGYFSVDPLLGIFRHPNVPTIDPDLGFSLRFSVRIIAESHAIGEQGDDNGDNLADRAGFSVIAVANDLSAIELGFWQDRIWAQDDDSRGASQLFSQAENVDIDTTARVIDYSLLLAGDTYQLFGESGRPLLSGRLRDYAAFDGTIDPYETPNFIFFGDNTTRAESAVQLGRIAFVTHDFDENGRLDVHDIHLLDEAFRDGDGDASFDLNYDHQFDASDRIIWIQDVRRTFFGDANLDGQFDSADLIKVFQAGQYTDDRIANSSWETGDWNGDTEFNTSDMILAFQSGGYNAGPRTMTAVPEPTGWTLLGLTFTLHCTFRWLCP